MTELKTLGFLGIGLLACLYATPVFGAQNVDLALQVAKVAANEGAFRYRVTTALVWQVVRENGRTPEERASFLARHSKRVHGTRPCYGGNCLWSPNLTRGDALPAGLLLSDQNIWSARVLPIWRDALAYADWLVAGNRKSEDPCPVKPTTWGGPMDRESAIQERGLVPILCRQLDGCQGNSCNDGFTKPKHCWKDGVWFCDPTLEPVLQSVQEPLGVVADEDGIRVDSELASR